MSQCSQANCAAAATCLPAFVIPFRDGQAPRRIVVPFEVCAHHARLIGAALASPWRQAMLARTCGTAAERIDWRRCQFELVPTTRAFSAVERGAMA